MNPLSFLHYFRVFFGFCGSSITLPVVIALLSTSLSAQVVLEERTYNAETHSLDVRLFIPVDSADSKYKGDQNYNLQFGLVLPDGYRIVPFGAWTSISSANCGSTFDAETGITTWEIYWQFFLGYGVPSLVDLQLHLEMTDLFGKVIWEGNLGDTFQRADDGMANNTRPGISVLPGTVPAFSGGESMFDLSVQFNNVEVNPNEIFGPLIDLSRRGINGLGIKPTNVLAELVSQEEGIEVWKRPFHLFRRGNSATAPFWVIVWLPEVGQIYCPLDLDVTGDSVVDDAPPELVVSDWCTKGEDPTYLDLYPLWGRSADTSVFVNATISDNTMIDPTRMVFFIDNPICIDGSFIPVGSVDHFKGDCVEGVFRSEIFVRNDINWNLWTEGTNLGLKVMVCDIFGQEAVFDIGDICLYGNSDLEVDVEKPEGIWNVLINGGEPIVVTPGEGSFQQVPVSLWAADAGKGIDSVSLSYRNEERGVNFFVFVEAEDLAEGTTMNGFFDGTTSISRCAAAGMYGLTSVRITDKAGNTCSFFNERALEKWLVTTDGSIPTEIQVINEDDDLTPSEMVGPLIFNPTTADITAGPASLDVSVDLKDEGCGISTVPLELVHCEDPDVEPIFIFLQREFGGDEFMGTYSGTADIPEGTPLGQYAPRLQIRDRAGNHVIFGAPFPEEFGIEVLPLFEGSTEKVAVISEIIKEDDLTPPELVAAQWDCTHDFGEAPGFVSLTFAARDLESGIDLGSGGLFSFGNGLNWVELLDPKGIHDVDVQLGLFDLAPGSDENEATFNVQFFLPKGVKPGDYCLRVHLTNQCGVSATYSLAPGDTPFPEGFPGGCTIINSAEVDCTPPIPVSFVATPPFLQSGEDGKLNIEIRITDLGMGFQSGNLEVKSGLTEVFPGFFSRPEIASTTILPPGEDERSVGTINDFVFTWEVDLLGDDFGGDFISFCLEMTDCADNERTYNTSICNSSFREVPLPFEIVRLGTNGNEDPVITSDGGGETADVMAEEDQTLATTVTATDADIPANQLTFSITGGADAALFDIDPNTGVLSFKTAPDFATPTDDNSDGTYEVIVEVSDGLGGMDSQAISVKVTEKAANDPPMITSNGAGDTANVNAEENETAVTTVTASDPDLPGDTLTFAITGGADAALFDIDSSTGVLTFKTAPVIATPTDANTDNVYEVTVQVMDDGEPVGMDSQDISVTVIEHIVDLDDYNEYANGAGSPFPSTATEDDKKPENDFDGDGLTNEEEFAAGTDPTNPDDYFWAVVGFDSVEGFKVVFCPYLPELNDYTLMNTFEGPDNNQSTALDIDPVPYEGDPTMGCFVVPPSGASLETLFLQVNTLKVSL